VDSLGKYQLTKLIAQGGMGAVYEAVDSQLERKVAIKIIRPELIEAAEDKLELLKRFEKEAKAAARLMHQNIVAIFEYGQDGDTPFFAMEFIEGHSLTDCIKKENTLDPDDIVTIMVQTLAGLQHAHERNIVHRDIKPANLILLKDGSIKIADFGIARIDSASTTNIGTAMGTPFYMSPEQCDGGEIDGRADLFSLGIVLFELLTGERPFGGNSPVSIMYKSKS